MPPNSSASDLLDLSAYQCPMTGSDLVQDGTRLRGRTEAGREYETWHGIPMFLSYDPAEDGPTKQALRRLNDLATSQGWRQALAEVYGEDSGMFRYVTDPGRLNFLDLLPLNDQSIVLEIGAGLGQVTTSLARLARAVYGLEVVPEQAEFVITRAQQEGCQNVTIAIGGDDCRLPYVGEMFDVVVLNLVLEWCATRIEDEPFVQGQKRLLDEICRVLKPGGLLFLTTKNRYDVSLLMGRQDEHAHGMRFGNALPRWLMESHLRRQGYTRTRGLLHSHPALRRLLEQAGFEETRSYWAAPEMRYAQDYVPNDSDSIRTARRRRGFVQGPSRRTRLAMSLIPAPLVKFFTPGLVFTAKRPA